MGHVLNDQARGLIAKAEVFGVATRRLGFKMAGATLVPFGRKIVKLEELGEPPPSAIAIGG